MTGFGGATSEDGRRNESRWISATAAFKGVRLQSQDLHVIAAAEAATVVEWRCSRLRSEKLHPVSDHKATFWAKVRREVRTGKLEELVDLAPKGKLFHLEVRLKAETQSVTLRLGSPAGFSRNAHVTAEGHGDEPPKAFREIAALLRKRSKERARTLWIISFLSAGFAPIAVQAVLKFAVALRSDPPQHANEAQLIMNDYVVPAAVIGAPTVFVLVGVVRWLTASSAIINPRFSRPDLHEFVSDGAKRVRLLYTREGYHDRTALVVATLGLLVALAGLIIAFFAWVSPIR
jgi:hypothetical protein